VTAEEVALAFVEAINSMRVEKEGIS